ncbi:MAG: hypothetical protein Q4E22_02110 [Coriobacteriia bacterium]|nr:hypothetical protein [Coriobacteriia bacterium]
MKAKHIISSASALLLVFGLGGAAFAAGAQPVPVPPKVTVQEQVVQKANPGQRLNQRDNCPNFVDEDGDGINDNRPNYGRQNGNGTNENCPNFVDEDGDGFNDNRRNLGRQNGNGTNENCPNFVDEDGDGVNDNCARLQNGERPQNGKGAFGANKRAQAQGKMAGKGFANGK